jgi:hypothetical protein
MSSWRYFHVCMKAAQNGDMERAIKYVKDELLTNGEYIQICLEMVLHSEYASALKNVKHERLSREDYLKICWASIIHYPTTICAMHEPTPDFCLMAARAGALRGVPEAMRTREICLAAVSAHRHQLDHVPEGINTPGFRAEAGISENQKVAEKDEYTYDIPF